MPVLDKSSPGKLTLANASAFWAGRVENWLGQVEFCIEHKGHLFSASGPEILFPTL